MSESAAHAPLAASEVDLDRIERWAELNPRQFFDPKALEELADSIREQGVVQPIVIRPKPGESDRYQIIAGERRWRAARMAGLSRIPATIKDVDLKTARAISLIENYQRDNVSPVEEAQKIRIMLDEFDGDRDEVARLLGITRKTVDSRMLLLHCTEPVQQSLIERKIRLGHAELLAVLPEKTQNGTLDKLLQENWSVSFLRDKVSHYLSQRSLAEAPFDTGGCNGCRYNSSDQAELFSVNAGSGKCARPECWSEKIREWLESRCEALSEEYPRIHLDTEKDPSSWVVLVPRGPEGVGEDQMDACRTCDHFGALMGTAPGKEGQILHDAVCFKPSCHKKKVDSYQSSLASTKAQSPATKEAAPKKDAKTGASESGASRSRKTAPDALPKRIVTHVATFHRKTAGEVVACDPKMVRVYAILALRNEHGKSATPESIKSDFPFLAKGSRAKIIKKLYALADDELTRIEQTYAAAIAAQGDEFGAQGEYLEGAKSTLECLGTDLTDHFRPDKAFWELHTIAGLAAVLRETRNKDGVTFADHHDANNGDGAFAKLTKGGRKGFIDAIVGSDYDFTGWLPKYFKIR